MKTEDLCTSTTLKHAVTDVETASESPDYWYGLNDEKAASRFLGVTPRYMQARRQKGGGPRFVRLSGRCIKYRRIDLKEWAEAHLRSSTAELT